MTKNKTVLAISVAGIGNTIIFTPLLRTLKSHGGFVCDIVVWNNGMASVVSHQTMCRSVLVVPKGWMNRIRFILKLRKMDYDYSVTAFPSNHWKYNVFAYLAGARKRITHEYPCCRLRSLAFLQNSRIVADESIHDTAQNLNMLDGLGIAVPEDFSPPYLEIDNDGILFANAYIKDRNIGGRMLIGVHPGAGGDWDKNRQGNAKRWPHERFAELCKIAVKTFNAHIILFGGPEEIPLKKKVIKASGVPEDVSMAEGSLLQTVALVSKCAFFVSNDSGLMHTAVALGIPTIGIMGPWNKVRTTPFGRGWHKEMRGHDKPYKFAYPFKSTSSRITTYPGYDYFEGVTAESVINVMRKKLEEKHGK